MEIGASDGCFVCGKNNPEGLGLDFEVDAQARTITSRWIPHKRFEGYAGIVHGGILATLLDEAVVKLCTELGINAVTAELSVRYLYPAPIERPLTLSARLTLERGRFIAGESEIILEDGRVAARAEVKCLRGKQ